MKLVIENLGFPSVLAGKPVTEFADGINPAALPPLARVSTHLDSVLHNSTMGLSNATKERVVDYKSKMALAYIGQPTLAAGYDSYGTFLGGGISFLWSDMLGNHNLFTAVQANTGLTGDDVFYFGNAIGEAAYRKIERHHRAYCEVLRIFGAQAARLAFVIPQLSESVHRGLLVVIDGATVELHNIFVKRIVLLSLIR